MMTLEINPPRHDRRAAQGRPASSRNLVLVASHRSQSPSRLAGPNGLHCTRVPAHVVAGSAAWCRRLSRRNGVSPRFAEPIGPAPGRPSDLPTELPELLDLMDRTDGPVDNQEAIARAIVALRSAEVVIAGPLSPDDANTPGLLPHLADLTGHAYRALRPPRELIVHPAFGQVARRFQFIQMGEPEARALGAGALDLGILAQRLRRLQGDPGEFAITAFGRHGLLWADGAWWDIDPMGPVNDSVAGAVFTMAWVVARRFRRAGAAQALAYARAVTIAAVRPGARS